MAGAKRKLILQAVIGAVVLIIGVFVTAVVAGFLTASGAPIAADGAVVWILGAFSVAVMIGSLVVGTLWMRSIDEAAREAHKAAWYWGGSAGMAVGGVGMILASLPQAATVSIPSLLSDRMDPAAYAATGAFAVMLLMLAGYIVVWAWWWFARSRG